MRSARLLLAAPAATALVFTGMAPAWAGGDHGDHHDGDGASAEVHRIGGEAELKDDGDVLAVRFKYECEDNDEELEADVKAENDSRIQEERRRSRLRRGRALDHRRAQARRATTKPRRATRSM